MYKNLIVVQSISKNLNFLTNRAEGEIKQIIKDVLFGVKTFLSTKLLFSVLQFMRTNIINSRVALSVCMLLFHGHIVATISMKFGMEIDTLILEVELQAKANEFIK